MKTVLLATCGEVGLPSHADDELVETHLAWRPNLQLEFALYGDRIGWSCC